MRRPKGYVFLRRIGLKAGVHFARLIWNRVWFSRELRVCRNVFVVSVPNESEKKIVICEFEMDFKKSYVETKS